MKKKFIVLLFTLGMLLTPIKAQAYTELPIAGYNDFISNMEIAIPTKENHLIIGHNGMKTFMSYTTITDKTSNQYALQQIAYTDEMGFRKVNDRYCVAIGTAFGASVGQIFDAELENGMIIKCIVGDIKDDKHTDKTNVFTSQGCCLEFIVDINQLDGIIKTLGDCSTKSDEWKSPCFQYIIYDIDYLKKGEDK